MRLSQEEFWAKIPYWVLTNPDFDSYVIRVYGVLSKHANWHTGKGHAGIRTIATEACCSTNTVLRALADLEAAGAVVVTREFHGLRPKVNQYLLPMFRVSPDETSPENDVSPHETYVSPHETPDVSPGETEQELKNQRTREDQFSTEEPRTIQPGETPTSALRRITTT